MQVNCIFCGLSGINHRLCESRHMNMWKQLTSKSIWIKSHIIFIKQKNILTTVEFVSVKMSNKINPMCVDDIYFIDQNQHSISQLVVICFAPGYLLYEPMKTYYQLIHGNKLQLHLHQNIMVLFKKMHFKMSSATWCPFCWALNVLNENRFCDLKKPSVCTCLPNLGAKTKHQYG